MFRNRSLTFIAVALAVCLTVTAAWVSPVGAMIFPDLLNLIEVDNDGKTEDNSGKDQHQGKQENQQQKQKNEQKSDGSESDADMVEENYRVKTGDTLWSLSRKYDVDWKVIAYANNLGLDGVIRPGQELTIPLGKGTTHIVHRGQNLYEIARGYGTTVADILAANEIPNPNQLQVGSRLIIPATESVAVMTPVRTKLSSRYEGYWRWPVKGTITSRYGPRGSGFHHGLDVAADTGTRIYPIRSGVVEFSGYLNNIYGQTVILDHGDGIRSLYAHSSENLVDQGDRVTASSAIAKIGNTGRSTGPHLHLEVYVDGETIDPQQLLN